MSQNDTEVILASAARTATTASDAEANHAESGVMLFLDVSANPGGVETLTLQVQMKDSISGGYRNITTFPAVAAATNASYIYVVYPGAVETTATANVEVQGVPLPQLWRVNVTHSAAGSWTYSVSAQRIV